MRNVIVHRCDRCGTPAPASSRTVLGHDGEPGAYDHVVADRIIREALG